MGTTLPPRAARLVRHVVALVGAAQGVMAVTGVTEITKAMVDVDVKNVTSFEAAQARPNFILMQTFQPKDVWATIMLKTSA